MLFGVQERLLLLDLLPKQGNYITLKIVRELREALSFDDAEIQTLELRTEGEQVLWNDAVAVDKDVTIGDSMASVISDTLKKRDGSATLSADHLPLYDQFVAAPAPVEG